MDGIKEENANDYIRTYSILLAQIEKVILPSTTKGIRNKIKSLFVCWI